MTFDAQGALLFVGNKASNNVSAYVVGSNGVLGQIAGSPFATAGQGPAYLTASGAFLFVADANSNDVTAFAIGNNGALSVVPGSPFGVGTSPQWVVLGK
jgi:6-phosphogluconolactonase (cycloisomerase 2 family)